MKLEDLSPELRQAGEVLAKAWQERPLHDQERFERTLSEDEGDADAVVADAVTRAERIAAVSGAVAPAALIPNDTPAQRAAMILDALTPSFDRLWKQDAWSWMLKSERRASVLRSLSAEQRKQSLVSAAAVSTDAAGVGLRDLLSGKAIDEDLPVQMRALAYQWASAAEPALAATVESLRREVARSSAVQNFEYLLVKGFFGREKEMELLRAFTERPETEDRVPVLPVSGVGGSGKSTLLAQVLLPMIQAAFDGDAAPMIVSLDFDRRSLLVGGELELSFELSRQLGLYYPQIDAELAAIRADVSRERVQRGELSRYQHDGSQESSSRQGEEFDYRAGLLLHNTAVRSRPLVLVLDTFEEWQRDHYESGWPQSGVQRVYQWLFTLAFTWQLKLRVILSGRSPPPEERGFAVEAKPIKLDELKRGESVAMLAALGIPTQARASLARMAGGMPLSLKLAARYYLQLPEHLRQSFVRDANTQLAGLTGELRQGVLYRRFLEHIPNTEARKLAHPGLALRRVSAKLIREVLSEPCGLGSISQPQANELFELLAREVWLVEESGPWLVHRPELRTMMLQSLRDDPVEGPRVFAVHMAAFRWYGKIRQLGEASDLSVDTEWFYHRLMVEPLEYFDALIHEWPPAVLLDIAQSANDFPPAIRVRLLDRVGRRLTEHEAKLLPADRRVAWAEKQAEELVAIGAPERALRLWARMSDSRPARAWIAAAKFQAQSWDDERDLFEADYSGSSLRFAYLTSFILKRRQSHSVLCDRLDDLLDQRLSNQENWDSSLVEDTYFARMVSDRSGQAHRALLNIGWEKVRLLDVNPTGFLRSQKILSNPPLHVAGREFYRSLAYGFRPTPEFQEKIIYEIQRVVPTAYVTVNFFRALDSKMQAGVKSAQVLGVWADGFANAYRKDIDVATSHGRRLPVDGDLEHLIAVFRPDDPEWRIPLRTALSRRALGPWVEETVEALQQILGRWVPLDLRPGLLLAELHRNPRRAWMRTIEYVDRCGLLRDFIARIPQGVDYQLSDVVTAYLDWDARRRDAETDLRLIVGVQRKMY